MDVSVCECFIVDLQYSADAEKVSFLLKAPLCFDLEMYSRAPRLEKVGVETALIS